MHVIDVLRGATTDKVLHWRHTDLSTFGIGADRSAQEWRAIVRQCIALGFLVVDHDAFGAMRLTAACKPVLRGEQRVTLRAYRRPARTRPTRRGSGGSAAAVELAPASKSVFERLRAWRRESAQRHGVPAYVIFHDATLQEIAVARPHSLEALRGISGIGARKLEAYGEEIIRLMKLDDD
jgi:ATP-dependent DNA helicase RecQ